MANYPNLGGMLTQAGQRQGKMLGGAFAGLGQDLMKPVDNMIARKKNEGLQKEVQDFLAANKDNPAALNAEAARYTTMGKNDIAKVFSDAAQAAVDRKSTATGVEAAQGSVAAVASNDPKQLRAQAESLAKIPGKEKEALELLKTAQTIEDTQNTGRTSRGRQGGLTAITQASNKLYNARLAKDAKAVQEAAAELKEAKGSVVALGGTAEEIRQAEEAGRKTKEGAKFGATVTEWTNPGGDVVLKTIQREDGKSYELGNTSAALGADAFDGLTKREKEGVNVNVGGSTETAYGKAIGQELAKADTESIAAGRSGANTLGTISEARLVLAENPEVLGIGGEVLDTTRKGLSRLMSGLGVDSTDPLFQQISEQNSAADMYKAFSQDFVRPRMEATKGAISNREYESFLASVPGLLSTPEGYKAVLDFMERASTAAVLKGDSIESALGTETPRASAKAARDQWTKFSSDFPLGSIPSKAMTEIWGDYGKEGFNKDNMKFTVTTPDGSLKQTTYKEIVTQARKRNIPSSLAIKQAFRDYGVTYIPMIQD